MIRLLEVLRLNQRRLAAQRVELDQDLGRLVVALGRVDRAQLVRDGLLKAGEEVGRRLGGAEAAAAAGTPSTAGPGAFAAQPASSRPTATALPTSVTRIAKVTGP